MREPRSIQLFSPPVEEPPGDYDFHKLRRLEHGGYERITRKGDLRTVECRSFTYNEDDPHYKRESFFREQQCAVIEWRDLIDVHSEVVEDDTYMMEPWQSCDGWEHTFHRDTTYWPDHIDASQMRGFVRGTYHTNAGVVEVNPKQAMLPDWEYYHQRGASKQVARQMAAQSLAKCIDQLVAWYEDGWQWYGVICQCRGHEASIWGVDDRKYAEQEVIPQMANEVASQLEAEGWIITGRPIASKLKFGWSARHWRDQYRQNMNMFNLE